MTEEKMVEIEVDLTDEEFLHVAKMAHENDITFNEMVVRILEEHIKYRQEQDNGTSNN